MAVIHMRWMIQPPRVFVRVLSQVVYRRLAFRLSMCGVTQRPPQ